MNDPKQKTPEQQAASKRSIERRFAREGREGYEDKVPLFVRVAESDLCEWDALGAAVLKEITFMRVWHAPTIEQEPKDLKAHRRTPANSPFEDYEGWCWASQETLAERCRTTQPTVSRKINMLLKKNILFKRLWYENVATGKGSLTRQAGGAYQVEHLEYKVNEEMVYEHQRTEPRPKKGRKAGTKAYKSKAVDVASVQHGRSTHAEKNLSDMTSGHIATCQPVISPHDNGTYRRYDSVS